VVVLIGLRKVIHQLVIVMFLFTLSGCVIVENYKRMIDGFDTYRSSVYSIPYNQDNTLTFSKSDSPHYLYFVHVDKKGRYIQYLQDYGSYIVGFPTVYAENYDVMIKKLEMFEAWANKPYSERLATLSSVQNSLPNNEKNPSKGITDFYLFMNPAVNNNTPYLAYDRDMDWFSRSKILLDKESVNILISELKIWHENKYAR